MATETYLLIVLAEERPVYVFCEYEEVACPGGDKCPIKKAFDLPAGRCVVRVLDGCRALDDGGLVSAYVQKEEFVIRSCAECRYNPVARAVIDELRAPKPREDIEYAPYQEGLEYAKKSIAAYNNNLGDFFKNYIAPAVAKEMVTRSAIYDRLLPIRPTATAAMRMAEMERLAHQAHVDAHVQALRRELDAQSVKMAGLSPAPWPLKDDKEKSDDNDED
jgi:hypothetical protein